MWSSFVALDPMADVKIVENFLFNASVIVWTKVGLEVKKSVLHACPKRIPRLNGAIGNESKKQFSKSTRLIKTLITFKAQPGDF